MKRNNFYILLAVIITILIFSCSAVCSQCKNIISNNNIGSSTSLSNLESTTKGINESSTQQPASSITETSISETSQTTNNETIISTSETAANEKVAPTIKLEIYEGPVYSSADDVYYYRIKAIVTGNPSPNISFSRDDSRGAWGKYIAQVNLKRGETYNLIAKATNSEGYATANINLSWESSGSSTSTTISSSTSTTTGESASSTSTSTSVATPSTTVSSATINVIFYPSEIGYIVYPSGINTSSAIIGDSISNSIVRGYFTFGLSGLAGKNIVSATLEMKTYKIWGNPLSTFLGMIDVHMTEDYLPLGPEDWMPLTTGTFAAAFYHDDEPLLASGDRLKNAIQQRVNEGKNAYFYIFYYNPEGSDNDFQTDGREFTKDTVNLKITYSG
ncbi:MAG: hypothetical protein M1479_10005 [Actinobacteria bacterium]|nr:hypothetical protein [Cyanobacteriota bacterium]MCL5772586.1 hypothetical protein [Actinomycetota bacterium]